MFYNNSKSLEQFSLLHHWKSNIYSVQYIKQLQPAEIFNNQSRLQRQWQQQNS